MTDRLPSLPDRLAGQPPEYFSVRNVLESLTAGHNREWWQLPDELGHRIVEVVLADLPIAALREEDAELDRAAPIARQDAIKAGIAALEAGQSPSPSLADPEVAIAARRADIAARIAVLDAIAAISGLRLMGSFGSLTDDVAERLREGLEDTLAAAAPHVAKLRGVAYESPSGLLNAPKPAQDAYRAVEALTARHDACRATAWALYRLTTNLWGREVPEWIREWEGAGLTLRRQGSPESILTPEYEPTGSAVRRLVEAVEARAAVAA